MKKQLRYITLEKFREFEKEINQKYREIVAILWEQLKFNEQIQTLMKINQNQEDKK